MYYGFFIDTVITICYNSYITYKELKYEKKKIIPVKLGEMIRISPRNISIKRPEAKMNCLGTNF